jgi:hypothetical protein
LPGQNLRYRNSPNFLAGGRRLCAHRYTPRRSSLSEVIYEFNVH